MSAAAAAGGAGPRRARRAPRQDARLQTAELVLSMLGADGPTLLDELRRTWLVARAGGASPRRLRGGQALLRPGERPQDDRPIPAERAGLTAPGSAAAAEPFQALLFEDVLVVARDGRDLDPMFLALLGSVEFDEAGLHQVRVRQWPGQEVVFSKLAGQTRRVLEAAETNRALLAEESAVTLAAAIPTLPAGPRGALAGMWLPGRAPRGRGLWTLSARASAQALRGEWLTAACPSRGGRASAGTGRRRVRRGWAARASWPATAAREPASRAHCGCCAAKTGIWFLEALSIEDRATYCFAGGEEVPALVSRLLCAPQFSREALYSPLAELTGDNAELAVPARSLGFLVELRERFRDRVIHQTVGGLEARTSTGWRSQAG